MLVGKGGGAGEGGGTSYDYLRIDTLVMKVSRKGAWTVSQGRAFQSFMCYDQ